MSTLSTLRRRQLLYALNAWAIAIAAGCSQSRDRQNLFLADRQQLDYGRDREAALQGIAKCYLGLERSLYLAILVCPP